MKIVIIGAGGTIGRAVADALVAQHHAVALVEAVQSRHDGRVLDAGEFKK